VAPQIALETKPRQQGRNFQGTHESAEISEAWLRARGSTGE